MRQESPPVTGQLEPYIVVRSGRLDVPVTTAASSNLSSYEGSNFRPLRTHRTVSDPFYCTIDPSQPSIQDGVKRMTTTQSKRLPGWAWWVLCKCLGVRLLPAERPILGIILYALTVVLAALYLLTFTWFTVFDIVSEYTKSTVLTGIVAIIIAIYWGALGVYGNRLASKLFASESFIASVRMHSKTFFRISAVGVLALVALVAMLLNDYQAATTYTAIECSNRSVSVHVCTTMVVARCSFSFVCWLWNVLVAMVVLSVCRTHTIGIRRFISQLEADGRLYESCKRQQYLRSQRLLSQETEDEYLWDEEVSALDDDYRAFSTLSANPSLFGSPTASPQQQRRNLPARPLSEPDAIDDEDEPLLDPSAPPLIVIDQELDLSGMTSDRYSNYSQSPRPLQFLLPRLNAGQTPPSGLSMTGLRAEPGSQRRNAPSRASVDSVYTVDSEAGMARVLTADDIMLCYWRINSRLRATSLALQRWLVAWVAFILLWASTFLIWWISNDATLLTIAQFVFPILILPIVCSVYGEVNNEGKRMLKCICPMEERVTMMLLLNRQPLEMTVFGFPVNYSAIMTFIGAVLVAFCSKIILERVQIG